jgi:hypothetical protein
MLTGSSAAIIGTGIPESSPDPIASIRLAKQLLASSTNNPSIKPIRLAMAMQNSADRIVSHAADTMQGRIKAPSIALGGIVPLYGSVNIIQPGEWISIYGSHLASGTAVWNP